MGATSEKLIMLVAERLDAPPGCEGGAEDRVIVTCLQHVVVDDELAAPIEL